MTTAVQPALAYIDALFAPTVTLLMPTAGAFGGTGPRLSWSGVLGPYTPFNAFGGGGGPPGGPREITGVVRDPDGVAADGYTVRLYSQDTGLLISETTSAGGGLFTFTDLDSALYYVVAVDNLAETWKAPIVDLVTPVLP